MEKNIPKMKLGNVDDLFKTQKARDDEKLEKVVDIKINNIDPFPKHPFKVQEDEEMYKLRDSIVESGVLIPVLVRPKKDGRYELISGHRRKRASELANLETIPVIVRDLTDDEATIIMVDSNMQREKIFPSEKAFAYKMKLEALKHQGKRTDLTSAQVGTKLRTDEIVGEEFGDSRNQVHRFIRLTKLIPELLEMVDKEQIAFNPAVELSYLSEDEQYYVLDSIEFNVATPSQHQAKEFRDLSEKGLLTADKINKILSEEKPNQAERISFNKNRIRSVLPNSIEESKVEDYVIKALVYYEKYLKKQKQREVR